MNRKQISALLVLKELGIQHHMASFADRLTVQKSVYLAQAAGVELGHHYNWYLRGPYSPSLTQDVFDALDTHDADSILDGWELDSETREKLSRLKVWFTPSADLPHPLWLELLASTHFLITRKQVATQNAGKLVKQLKKFDKDFTKAQVQTALKKLRSAGLLDAATS